MEVKFLDLHAVNSRFESAFMEATSRVLHSGWYIRGHEVENFEKEFAASVGAEHCVGVANGFDALYLCLLAQKQLAAWADGDEVIVPAHSFVASAQSIVQAGLRPIFVDIDANDYLIDTEKIEACISVRTRAIMPVHLYGMACNMPSVMSLAQKHQLFVIEDAAQAHGAVGVGAGDTMAYSFYPGKNLGALGDGGAVVCRSAVLAERIRQLANYGAAQKYHHSLGGVNSRLDELQAALLRVKLPSLHADNQRRQQIASQYDVGIANPAVRLPYCNCLRAEQPKSVYHIYPIFCEDRMLLQKHLQRTGVETIIHYPIPLHRQQSLQRCCTDPSRLNVAEKVCQTELSLPISPVMTDDEVAWVIDSLNSFRI